MDVTLDDAVFVVHWMASRSVAEVGRRLSEPMTNVLGIASRLRDSGWPLPPRPAEDTAPHERTGPPVLASHPDDPTTALWVDGEGAAWTFAGRGGHSASCRNCGQSAGANGYNRLTRKGEPGRRFACANCVRVVTVPSAWSDDSASEGEGPDHRDRAKRR